jgi:hypothetical protein
MPFFFFFLKKKKDPILTGTITVAKRENAGEGNGGVRKVVLKGGKCGIR